jgi:hypothetical protein
MNKREGKRARVMAQRTQHNIASLAEHKGEGTHKANKHQPDLADALSAVMLHPDLPDKMYNSFTDVLSNLPLPDTAINSAPFIRERLRAGESSSAPEDDVDEGNNPNDALTRAQHYRERDDPAYQRKITPEEAADFVEWISKYDDDAVVFGLIRIMNGIMAVLFETQKVEEIVMAVRDRAYTHTGHFSQSIDEFGSLDEKNPRDKRVILREYEDETEDEREAAGIDK